ncbi:MAG TPA: DUF4139 domain-containing protein [Cellvibrio sp.]|nr:DUF4139 domain-containing protein [Cellvibrio sp.]
MRSRILPFILSANCFVFASLVQAQTATNQQLYITVYNNNLALVEDKRTLDLPQGHSKIEFKGVSANIRPETVSLNAQGVHILEQNFDFDLLTPDKLMEKSVGQQVQLLRTNPGNGQQTTENALVLSVNEGVVLNVNGRIEVLRADAIPTRVIFNKIPDNLRASPQLSISVDADKAGARTGTLSYLTTGISWKADYVALFDEKSQKLDLQGWVTLTNNSGTTFTNANAQLIAGEINLSNNWGDYESREKRRLQTRRQPNSDISQKMALADYYAYPLLERTTIANKQTKQVGFLETKSVAAKKVYSYKAGGYQTTQRREHADVLVRFSNTEKGGLGTQLPAGIVRVYVRDNQAKPTFIGESAIEHNPLGSNISVRTGEAFDVTVEPATMQEDGVGKSSKRYTMTYTFDNARKDDITVEFEQTSYRSIRKVVSETIKSEKSDAYTLRWNVPVPANDSAELKFVVDVD